jgi:hypothetical protein
LYLIDFITCTGLQGLPLPESIGNLTNLTDLDLSFNDLNTLPKSIGNLTNLNVLDLRENNVRSKYALPECVGQLRIQSKIDIFPK